MRALSPRIRPLAIEELGAVLGLWAISEARADAGPTGSSRFAFSCPVDPGA